MLIPDLKACFEKASNDTMRRLNSIVTLGFGLHIALIAQGKSHDINSLYHGGELFTINMVKQSVAILSGGSVLDHNAFSINRLSYTEKAMPLNEEYGYVIEKQGTTKIKMLQK